MKIGIVSDTHDNLPAIERIVERLNAEKVDLVLHAGDFVSPFTAGPFGKLGAPLVGVFGNNDGDRLHLARRFDEIGTIYAGHHTFEVDGVRVVLMHEPKSIDALAASGAYDLVVYGHTHKVDVRPARSAGSGPLAAPGQPAAAVVNPGEACGWLTGRSTAVLFDTKTRTAEVVF
ncbi:MAG: metallophosphoesterase [Candidatus Bipolaricaulota bacterium]|nr:metallophosphoesterase [Candidatus Bipolaricaulota bacterium]